MNRRTLSYGFALGLTLMVMLTGCASSSSSSDRVRRDLATGAYDGAGPANTLQQRQSAAMARGRVR